MSVSNKSAKTCFQKKETLEYTQMDPRNYYGDVIVISDDDDAVNSEFKDEQGDKDNHLMPKKKKFYKYIKTRFDVYNNFVWITRFKIPFDESQIPDNSIIREKIIIENRYHCHFCELVFPKDRHLYKHLNNNHQHQNTNKKITCKYCGKLFSFNFQLKRHIRRKMYQYIKSTK